MVGEHNHQNLLMAVAAARLAGMEKDVARRHNSLVFRIAWNTSVPGKKSTS